jgi:pilus assembly protein CpaE
MTEKMRVLIVDDLATTRESVRKLLQFEPSVELAGEAASGTEAIAKAHELNPDIILMDINMPDMDGITASQRIVTDLPAVQIIIMSVQGETDYMRKAMLAGARDFLTKPFSLDELLTALHNARQRRDEIPAARAVAPAARPSGIGGVATMVGPGSDDEEGAIVVVYGPKGGAGTTTVAVNVAVALARQRATTVLVDGSLQFGDVGVMLNLKPVATILDLIERTTELDHDLISSVVTSHRSGLKVLIAPPRPEMAEAVQPEHMEALLKHLRRHYAYVIVDTGSKLDDVTLAMLDLADRILLVTQTELPAIKNASRFLDLANDLGYPREKVILVVNEVIEKQGISPLDVAKALKRPSPLIIPFEEREARRAVNQGEPLILGRAQKRPVAIALNQVARRVASEVGVLPGQAMAAPQERKTSFLGRLVGRR